MDEQTGSAAMGGEKDEPKIVKVQPTLFIGVGGTGLQVMLRIRRRILNAVWNGARIDSLAHFPIAGFLYYDVATHENAEDGRAQKDDPLADLVSFKEEDRLTDTFDLGTYIRSDDDLAKYPHIQSWMPLPPSKIRDLQFDPGPGAGQIRGISRLYFFDKYPRVRAAIQNKLAQLQQGLNKSDEINRLGFNLDGSKVRIVVVCSVAGGTGSGSFLDMGWLCRWLGKEAFKGENNAKTELFMFLPTGYASAGRERTEANSYAALMELEAAMRGDLKYVDKWDRYENPELEKRPYNEVYLLDSGTLAGVHTGDVKDVYEMLADSLFEDFLPGPFSMRKRSVSVNQIHYKGTYTPPPTDRFGEMKLIFSQIYSALGQAVLDTQASQTREMTGYRWTAGMLKAFFGVGVADARANLATDRQRDEFMSAHLKLKAEAFSDFPEFSAKVELKRSQGPFPDYVLTGNLLHSDRAGSLVDAVQQKVHGTLEHIQQSYDKDEWGKQVREVVRQLERDVLRDQDSAADTVEDHVSRRRRELLRELTQTLDEQLYKYLDDKDFGGLEYVISLVEQIKDRLTNSQTGLIAALKTNADRYSEIRDAIRTHEYERLLANLDETRGKDLLSIFGSKTSQAEKVLAQLKTEIGNYLKFHLRAKAAAEAAKLLEEVSQWLGDRQGDDDTTGLPIWSGFVGELQRGRQAVQAMLGQIERLTIQIHEDSERDHACYLRVKADIPEPPLPSFDELRTWADEAFKDFGGSKAIFIQLSDDSGRGKVLRKAVARAYSAIPTGGADQKAVDPLAEVLGKMSFTTRQQLFEDWLKRAMPWVDANIKGDFKPSEAQYECFIGVSKKADFAKFEPEIMEVLPVQAGITSRKVEFVETGVSGRAVCYTELSGIPLTVLKGLSNWRTSYRKQSEPDKIPVHTHRDPTLFVHPLVPSTADQNALADDFQLFLQAVVLGVLERKAKPSKDSPPGQYDFLVDRGDRRQIGNERAIRTNGLPIDLRPKIAERVQEELDRIDSPRQWAALSVLFSDYGARTYKPIMQADATGKEKPCKGFASSMADEMDKAFKARAGRNLGSAAEQTFSALHKTIVSWTREIPGSDTDSYAWEVAPPTEEDPYRFKRILLPDFFTSGWIDQFCGEGGKQPDGPGREHPPLIPGGSVPPPIPPGVAPPQVTYLLHLNGQQYGPYPAQQLRDMMSSGQVAPTTLAWREGMAQWQALNTLPEFMAPPPGLGIVPPPPPPPTA